MQPDGGWIFAAGLAGRLRCYLSSVSGRCAAPPLSTRAHVCRLCMVHVPASLPIMFALPSPISSWRTSLHPIADAMVRVPPCVQLTLESVYALHSLNVGWFQAAAWDFDMLLEFARVESGRAHRCDQCRAARVVVPMRCARLRALGVGGLRRHGDHRCDLHGGGPCVGARGRN